MSFLSIAMVFVIVLNVLRLINLWFEPRILRHPLLFKEKPDKYHYTMYYLMLILILGSLTLDKLKIVDIFPKG